MIHRKIRHILTVSFRNIAIAGKIVDSFYTIHLVDGRLLYISNVVNGDGNPDFEPVSIPRVHHDRVVIRLWAKVSLGLTGEFEYDSSTASLTSAGWKKLAKYNLSLNGDLVEIENSNMELSKFNHNAILVKLVNGVSYTTLQCLDGQVLAKDEHTPETLLAALPRPSYTFDSIRSINSLHRARYELSLTKAKLSKQIDLATAVKHATLVGHIEGPLIDKSIEKQKLMNDATSSRIINLKLLIGELTRLAKESKIEYTTANEIEYLNTQFEPLEETLALQVYPEILDLLRSYTSNIQEVYVIKNIDNSVKFQILGIPFPSSMKKLLDSCYYGSEEYSVQSINTGIEYITRTIVLLAQITRTNLKYHILVCEDRICIHESSPTSLSVFPLGYFPENNTKYINNDKTCLRHYSIKNTPFEVGLSLLNWNMMSLLRTTSEIYRTLNRDDTDLLLNIPMDCMDNFLWNLQYLILYLSATPA